MTSTDTTTHAAPKAGRAPRAALYLRISRDGEGEGVGVAKQREDCLRLAERLGASVAEVFEDNNVSASSASGKARPEYLEMLAGAKAGAYDLILAYSNSRLTRRPREFEDLVNLTEKHGVKIKTVVSGEWNLATADGRATARTIAAWDAAEAERTSERLTRHRAHRAEAGWFYGRRPYGYTKPERGRLEPDPTEAPIMQEAARRVLAGEALNAIAADFNARAVPTTAPKGWAATALREKLLRPVYAGLLVHQGKVLGAGPWEPLWPRETHDALRGLLMAPERNKTRSRALRYILSGAATCGVCGGVLRARPAAGRTVPVPVYYCRARHCVSIPVEMLEPFVTEAVLTALEHPDAALDLSGDPAEAARQAERATTLQARLDAAADDYSEGLLTREQLHRITAKLRPQIDAAQSAARAAGPRRDLARWVDGDVRARWARATETDRRALVGALVDVVVQPVGRGLPSTTERITVTPKG